MSSWSRRVSAASARPGLSDLSPAIRRARDAGGLPVGAPEDLLPEDEAALVALVTLAREQADFRKTVTLRVERNGVRAPIDFEVAYGEDGPTITDLGEHPEASAVEGETHVDHGDHEAAEPGFSLGRLNEVLTNALVSTPDLVALFASVGHEALWANDAFATVLPVRKGDKIWLVDLLDDWSKGHYEVNALPSLFKFGRWQGHLRLTLANEVEVPVSAVLVAHRDKTGDIEAVSMVARDVTRIRAAEAEAADAEAPLAALAEQTSDIIFVVDEGGSVRYASPAAARALGHGPGDLTGVEAASLFHEDDLFRVRTDTPDERDDFGLGTPFEIRVLHADGEYRKLDAVATNLVDNPAIAGVVINARDLSERAGAIAKLTERAYTDPLTGLATKVRLLDRLGKGIRGASEAAPVGVVLLAVDRFAAICDALGSAASDDLLAQLSARMTALVGEDDTLARLNEEEFVLVAPGVASADELRARAEALRGVCNEPYSVTAHGAGAVSSVKVSLSAGIVVCHESREPDDVLRDAVGALERSKELGGDRTEEVDEQVRIRAERRLTVEVMLRRALDEDGIAVHYQPVVDLHDGRIVGAEALLRVDEDTTLLSPADFVEAAEDNGLIAPLGAHVLSVACEQLAPLADLAPEIHVNVSPRQLTDPEFPEHVVEALRISGAMPERLCLEITESALIAADSAVDQTLAYLRAVGIRVGLDDFGAGHSSLGYLKRFPLDFVKIDRSFITGVGVEEQDTAIVRATIDLAHNLGLIVMAVGVENEEQLQLLTLLGCDRAQGWYFSKALPIEEFTERLHAGA